VRGGGGHRRRRRAPPPGATGPRTGTPRSTWAGPSPLPRRLPSDHDPVRYGVHPGQAPRPPGPGRRPLHRRGRRLAQPQGPGRASGRLERQQGEAIALSTTRRVPRQARGRHEGRTASMRRFDTLRLIGEEAAGFESRPVGCRRAYRVVVPRKEPVVGRSDGDRPAPTPRGVLEDQYRPLVTPGRVEAGVVPRWVGERFLYPTGLTLAGRLPGPGRAPRRVGGHRRRDHGDHGENAQGVLAVPGAGRGPLPLDARGRPRRRHPQEADPVPAR